MLTCARKWSLNVKHQFDTITVNCKELELVSNAKVLQ
jgi:hypothetical protein